MTPHRVRTIKKLRRLAKTMTQAQAARRLGVRRQYVHELARDYGIRFRSQPKVAGSSLDRRCGRCAFRIGRARACLRCKWTPERVKRLRKRYGLSQVRMALDVLEMNVWACRRWESGGINPSRRALGLLEDAERNINGKAPPVRATARSR